MAKQSGLSRDDVELSVEATSRRIDAGEVTLHAVEAGPEDGELVVLLHGFPECWYAWTDYLRPLTEAGYRVVALDQRGYNLSDRPSGVEWYSIDELAGDVVGVADALGHEKAHVVGHDWGGAVAWWTALHHRDRVRSLTAMNLPHPAVLSRHLRRDPAQQLRSWYVLFFQLPKLPELLAPVGDWAVLERTMTGSALPGTFSATDLDCYRAAWSVSGAYGSMVDWYRAVARERPRPRAETVEPPTLVVWGSRDRFLRPKMARESLAFCEDGHLKTFDEATHWVHHEEPVAVARALVEHLDDAWRTPNNTPDEAGHRPV
ncbi:alpha/beta fold hydrolase [Haloferax prahovense]|uniref:alpha/beta fold hydrolase n=1 Tax=Haloferax TaxID=2251 RepID=UPI00209C1939|nr:alpha/beta fold hydrolase [Haloferax sp. AB510]MCO8267291.1 alpha/beta fold hydrolase [Haloferax sp. AB510]